MTDTTKRVILPAEAVGKAPQVQAMLECWHRMKCWMGQLDAGRKMPAEKYGYIHRKMEIEADQLRLHLLHPEISAASPNAGKVTEADLNALAAAIKKASSERRYGKYDYSEYPGKEPPFVVRDERTGDAVFRSWSRDEAEREYARLCDEHIARTAVSALGLEVE